MASDRPFSGVEYRVDDLRAKSSVNLVLFPKFQASLARYGFPDVFRVNSRALFGDSEPNYVWRRFPLACRQLFQSTLHSHIGCTRIFLAALNFVSFSPSPRYRLQT